MEKAHSGVYFIKYVVTGLNGEEKIGHTYFHLIDKHTKNLKIVFIYF